MLELLRRRAFVIAACAAVAAVVLGFTFFRDSDEERVKKALAELAKIVMVKDGDTILSRTARLRSKLPDVVENDVRVSVSELSFDIRGRAAFEDGAAKAGLLYSQADCAFASEVVKIDPSGTLATVEAVALLTATPGGEAGKRSVDKRTVHFLLRKDGACQGAWCISTIDVFPRQPD